MNALKGVILLLSICALFLFSGCSSLKNEPVYMDVPDPSAPQMAVWEEVSPAEPAPVVQPAATEPAVATAAAQAEPVQEQAPAVAAAEPEPEPIVTPDDTLRGTVVSVNDAGRFVVLRFPLGRMPTVESKLYAYRQGLKVADLKVTGPQKDDHTVADIVAGDCLKADEVRDR